MYWIMLVLSLVFWYLSVLLIATMIVLANILIPLTIAICGIYIIAITGKYVLGKWRKKRENF